MQTSAAFIDDGLKVGKVVEVPVDEGLVDEFPETFGGLEFGTVGRQMDEPYAVGNDEARLGVPSGVVKNEEDGAMRSRAGLLGEGVEKALEERLGDAIGDIPDRLAGGGRDKCGHIEPFKAVMAEGDGTLPFRRPDAAQDRLQSDPMFVGGKDFDRPARVLGLFLGNRVGEFF